MDKFEPYNWNAVVVGSWNRAILTPSGISSRLFKLPEGSGVQVLIPVEGLGPSKVIHEGLAVAASSSKLIIEPDVPNYQNLERARDLAAIALTALPETPVTAAGFNIRFKGNCDCDELSNIFEPSRNLLADSGYAIASQSLVNKVEFDKGFINLRTDIDSEECRIEVNFHMDSNEPKVLKTWLEIPVSKIEEEVENLIQSYGITLEKGTHA